MAHSKTEMERVAALRALGILDAPLDAHFDATCRLATKCFDVEAAAVSFVDSGRLWFKASAGIGQNEGPREGSFCSEAIGTDEVFVVEDAWLDVRFASDPLVTGPSAIRFYAGIPLFLEAGTRLGTFCIMDRQPRTFPEDDRATLRDFAEIITAHLRLHVCETTSANASGLLRATLENMNQGLLMIGPDLRVQVFNDRVIELLGLPRELVEGKPLFEDLIRYQIEEGEFRSDDHVARRWMDSCKLHASADVYERERDNGTVLEVSTVPLAGGGAVRTYTDVSDRKLREAALREAEAGHQALFVNAAVGLYRTDATGRLVIANPALCQMHGFKDETELLAAMGGLEDDLYVDPERRKAFFQAVHRTGRVVDFVSEIRVPATGKRIWISVNAWTVCGPDGQVVGYEGTVVDATARKVAEQQIQDSETRYRTLSDALPQMIWIMQPETGRCSYSNRQFSIFYGDIGPEREERVSRNHPDDAERMARHWNEALAKGAIFSVEGRLRRHDGVYRWHKLVMIPIVRDGVLGEWLGTALDIDEIVVARQRLTETTDLLRLAQEAAGAGAWDLDLSRNTAWISPESAGMNAVLAPGDQRPDTPLEVSVQAWAQAVFEADRDRLVAERRRAIENGGRYDVEFRVVTEIEGKPVLRWLHSLGSVVCDAATGRAVRIVGLDFDITDRRQHQEELQASQAKLRESQERLAHALESGSDGLWDADLETGHVWLSDHWYRMLGYLPGEVERTFDSWKTLIHPDDVGRASGLFLDHLKGKTERYECEYRMLSKTGGYTWLLARARIVERSATGRGLRVVGTHVDITARKIAEQRVERMALHDGLTDLPNRVQFHAKLKQAVAKIGRGGPGLAVLAVDLDRFKSVNDAFGHPIGDALLREVADRMAGTVGRDDLVARLGGDEFAIIQFAAADHGAAQDLAIRLIRAIGLPMELEGQAVVVEASVGVALVRSAELTPDTLFKAADLALRHAKADGRNTVRFFSEAMGAADLARHGMEADMRSAIERREFEVFYQPIYSAERRLCSFEALLRWRHPRRGLIPPSDFIALAEETRLIVPLGDWVLREACRAAKSWPGDVCVSVNVSAIQFVRPGFAESVVIALAATGLPAHRLELEITETALMQEGEALASFANIKALGVKIALDDFGTGYSSLSYLHRLPFDRIKIDRSFINAIDDMRSAAIVRAAVSLGTSMDMAVTAEGVETEYHYAAARELGCTDFQGYLFGRPIPKMSADGIASNAAAAA